LPSASLSQQTVPVRPTPLNGHAVIVEVDQNVDRPLRLDLLVHRRQIAPQRRFLRSLKQGLRVHGSFHPLSDAALRKFRAWRSSSVQQHRLWADMCELGPMTVFALATRETSRTYVATSFSVASADRILPERPDGAMAVSAHCQAESTRTPCSCRWSSEAQVTDQIERLGIRAIRAEAVARGTTHIPVRRRRIPVPTVSNAPTRSVSSRHLGEMTSQVVASELLS
jgi:hypothetical protein